MDPEKASQDTTPANQTPQSAESVTPLQPASLEEIPQPKKKRTTVRGLIGQIRRHPTVGLFITLALVLLGMVLITSIILFFAGYPIGGLLNKKATNATTQSLTDEQLDSLSKSSASIGGAGQTLLVGANAQFKNDLAVDHNVNVAGTLNATGATTLSDLKVNGSFSPTNLSVGNNLIVAGTTTLQKSATVADFLNVGSTLSVTGNASIGGNLTVGNLTARNTTLNGPLTVAGHIITSGATPGVSAGSVGAGGTVSLSGNDQAGTVNINTGGSPASGTLATITFKSPFSSTPHVIISPVGSGSASLNYYVTRTSTGFVIGSINAPAGGSVFSFDYFVAQ